MNRLSFLKSLAIATVAPKVISAIPKEPISPAVTSNINKPISVVCYGIMPDMSAKDMMRIYDQTGNMIWKVKNTI